MIREKAGNISNMLNMMLMSLATVISVSYTHLMCIRDRSLGGRPL